VATAPGSAVLGARIYVLGVAGDGCLQVTLLIHSYNVSTPLIHLYNVSR
jgi:hypothetical protein